MVWRLKKTLRKFIVLVGFVFCLSAAAIAAPNRYLPSSKSAIGDWLGLDVRPYGGVSTGILSFYGDVRPTSGHHWFSGYPGAKLDLLLEVGKMGEFCAKAGFMYAYLKSSQKYSGNNPMAQMSPNSLTPLTLYEEGNLNFRSNLFNIALQGEYRIRVIPGMQNIYPYISTGVNILFFNPYADRSANGVEYELQRLKNYRDAEFDLGNTLFPTYDKKYETKLKSAKLYGQKISTVTVGFPLEAGFDFRVLPTVNIRFGTSFTFTLSDDIDGVSGKAARKGKSDQNAALTRDPAGTSYWNNPANIQTQRAARLQTNHYNDFFAYTYVACYIYLPFL
ncbi:MAG: hypothetical protein LBB79_07605 [Prevotellaceae bacterium]|jgi:hypothetical protein|nr:hypothetical protein [Prevotellaceae bacterium]